MREGQPSLRYQKAQAARRAAIAADRAEALRRSYALRPRIAAAGEAEAAPPKEHAALLRDLLAISESHRQDGNLRTAHCLSAAAQVIAELQARLDASGMT